jgi:hypothetical protein
MNSAFRKDETMIRMTIREARERVDESTEQCIYCYRDGDTIFYIGRSDQPLERLEQHLGAGSFLPIPDPIGTFILDHHPLSLDWTVEIYTVRELDPEQFKDIVTITRDDADWIEGQMIFKYGPCFNGTGNKNRKHLPEQYQIKGIANAGVTLSSSLQSPANQNAKRGKVE